MLFEHAEYEQATREYERTAYAYTFHDKAAEAGYAALLAYRKHEEELAAGPEREAWHTPCAC